MRKNDLALVKNHLGKLRNVFFIVVTLIAVMELILMTRGLLLFNLERLKLRLYLYSYIFLFVSSAAVLIVLAIFRDWEKYADKLVLTTYIYAFCLVFWSAFITCIDCYANGDSGVMVYVMTCISVGVLTLMKPVYFVSLLGSSCVSMMVAIYFARGQVLYSSGFYINFMIFMVLAVFLNAHNYSLSRRAYESSKLLKSLSNTDQLTGIYNRRHLDEKIASYYENGEEYLFILADADNFKRINDTYGHAVGDECLVLMANTLCEHFGDGVYRFGGDEFAIVSSFSYDEAAAHIDAVNEILHRAYENVDLHLSAGLYRRKRSDPRGAVFIYADRALYKAKRGGKSNWAVYDGDPIE